MKKILFTLTICTIGLFQSCQDVNISNLEEMTPEINFKYQELTDFSNYLEIHNLYNRVSDSEINYEASDIEINDDVNILHIVLNRIDGKLMGVIHGFKVAEQYQDKLENFKEYAIVYESFNGIDQYFSDGTIETYDWNFNKLVSTLTFEDSKLSKIESPGTNIIGINPNVQTQVPESCSGGDDGDVGWGECIHCLRTICHSDPDCSATLTATDILGAFRGYPGAGTIGIGAACLIIAATN